MNLGTIKHILLGHREYFPGFRKKFASFGDGSSIQHPSVVSEHENISIGKNTVILNNSRIQVYNCLTGYKSKIRIGDNCYIGFHLTILAGGNVTIGNEVLIASDVLITSENHGTDPESETPYMDQLLICKDVTIGNGCWIGEKASILPGVSIGEKCIIATNSVVTKSIPAFSIAAGIPARVIKQYNFEKHCWEKI